MKKFVQLTVALITLMLSQTASSILVADFFREAEFESIAISPTGEYLASVVPLSDRSALAIMRLSDMKQMGVFKPETDAYIDDYQWVSDKRIIFNTAKKFGRIESPYKLPGLWAMDFDGKNKKNFSERRWILSDLPKDEDNVLVQYYDSSFKTTYGLQNTYTGKIIPSKQISPSKKTEFEAEGYIADHNGNVLIFVASYEDTDDLVFYIRRTPNDPWSQVYDERQTKEALEYIGFSKDNKLVYFSKETNAGGPDSVIAIDMERFEISSVIKDDNVDPYGSLKSPVDGSVYAIRYLDGLPRYDYLQSDNIFAIEHKKLRNTFPGQDVIPLGYTKDCSKAIFAVFSDRNPGDYYLYDRITGKAQYILSDMQWINPEEMAETKPIIFKSRDGLSIEAFLTLPKNRNSNVPVVINPHGGPFGVYDTWTFSPDIQLLALKGYAVLQINFRGSGNYGKQFEESGYRQWGKKMQDDITDATKWLIDSGIANKSKICIYGSSFGAYAALMGVIRESDLYACAVGYVGVYDLPKVVKDDSKGSMRKYSQGWWLKKYFNETLVTDELDQISPVNLASKVNDPILLGGGELDQIAPIEHTKMMNKALEKAGKQTDMQIYYNEGHGNYLPGNQLHWANRVINFLNQNIGSGSSK